MMQLQLRTSLSSATLTVAIMAFARVSRAETPITDSPAEESILVREQRLIESGYALRKAGRDAEALALYQQAYALRLDTKALAQMALAEEALGNWRTSYRLLQQALADRAHPWIEANRESLAEELVRISGRLGQLTLVVNPIGASVVINGEWIGAAPLQQAVMLNPGPAEAEVVHLGYISYRRKFDIVAGAKYREVIELQKNGANLAASTPAHSVRLGSSSPGRGQVQSNRNPLWLGVAIGGAAISATSLVPWLLADNKVNALAEDCRSGALCDLERIRSETKTLDYLTNVLLISGLGVTTVSTVLYLISPKAQDRASPNLSAWGSPNAGGLSYGQRF